MINVLLKVFFYDSRSDTRFMLVFVLISYSFCRNIVSLVLSYQLPDSNRGEASEGIVLAAITHYKRLFELMFNITKYRL